MNSPTPPPISLIVPTYNGQAFLTETVASVQAQTLTAWELVLVDDGSTDDTRVLIERLVEGDPRLRTVSQKNQGVAAARNTGFALASPETGWLLFLDHDDLLYPDALETLLTAAQGLPEDRAGVHGWVEILGGEKSGEIMHRQRLALSREGRSHRTQEPAEPTGFDTMAYDCCLVTPGAALLRHSALRELCQRDGLLFDPSTAPCDDWDLWLRLTSRRPLAMVPKPIVRWRQHAGNASLASARMLRRQSDVRRKVLLHPSFSESQKETMYRRYRRMLARELRHRANLAWRTGNWYSGWMIYGRYLQARWLWGKRQDRGEIPWCGLEETLSQ